MNAVQHSPVRALSQAPRFSGYFVYDSAGLPSVAQQAVLPVIQKAAGRRNVYDTFQRDWGTAVGPQCITRVRPDKDAKVYQALKRKLPMIDIRYVPTFSDLQRLVEETNQTVKKLNAGELPKNTRLPIERKGWEISG